MFGTPFFCMQYVCGVLRSDAFDGMLQNAKRSRRVKSKELSFSIRVVFFFEKGNFAEYAQTPQGREL